MNKQFEPLFTPYDAWLWAHPPVYAIANGGLGAIRAKTTVFIVSKCNRRHPFRVHLLCQEGKRGPLLAQIIVQVRLHLGGPPVQVASLRGMDAVEHIELVIFLRNLIHLGIIPQVDDPDLILFLQLQQLLHHLAVGGLSYWVPV